MKNSENNIGLNREQLLHIALAWDAIEVAKEYIIKDDLNDLNVNSLFRFFLEKFVFLQSETKENLFFEALILDRSQFINTFIKLNFNLPEMFYERQTNKPWKLKWDQLAKLYDENDQKKVRQTALGQFVASI